MFAMVNVDGVPPKLQQKQGEGVSWNTVRFAIDSSHFWYLQFLAINFRAFDVVLVINIASYHMHDR